MLCLMQNKKANQRLLSEIDEALQTEKIPTGEEEVVSDSQARQLPYLQAAIKEVRLMTRIAEGRPGLIESRG